MNYCIVNADGIIENIIVCDNDDIAAEFNAMPIYDGATIGGVYAPPPTTEERLASLEKENKLLNEKVSAQADQQDFYEDCIAEMAAVVYA